MAILTEMHMFEQILVPTDLTEGTVDALKIARRLADPARGRVVLLHVIETIAGATFEELEPFYRDLEEKARSRMDEIILAAEDAGPAPAMLEEVSYGSRAAEIVRFAAERQIDLIVLASPVVDRAKPVLGSVSYKVSVLAPCPVLLLK